MIESLYLKSQRPQLPPLRVGLLLDDLAVIRPFGTVIDHLLQADFVRLELLVLHDAEPRPEPPLPRWSALLPQRLRNLTRPDIRPHLLFGIYEALDARRNPAEAALFRPVDYSTRLKDVPRIQVRPISQRFVHRFPEESLARIRQYGLDVLLRFGFNILRGGILQCARHGVWSYHHGDHDFYRGGPAHFWEMVERNPVSGVMLQVLSEELDAGRVLTRGIASTLSFTSLAQNRISPYATGDTFVIRKLWELHSYGKDHLDKLCIPPAPYQGRKKIYRRPRNAEMARIALPWAASLVRNRFPSSGEVFHWRIGIRTPPRDPFPGGRFDPQGFHWLEAPRGHFYADPFAIRRGGQDWILFEDYDYSKRKGILAAARLENGALGPAETVLEEPYHLSYPFLWEQDGELFMIPESGANRTVDLYRCTGFPGQWKRERTLLEGPAVDTTVLSHDGRLWFFVSLQDRPAAPQLFLFSAPSLFDSWTYHPANPISLDIRTSRCGGAIFSHQGRLIRPAQDGSVRYGYALRFQQITRLTPEEYAEQPAAVLTPGQVPDMPGLKGVHTYNRYAGFELLDSQTAEPLASVSL